jgi:tetratricopeptide (TPR) repeat protein
LNFTIILDNSLRAIAAILVVLVIAAGLGWVIISNFVVRGVADRRVLLPREWLLAARERFPDSARINIRLAEAEMAGAAENGGAKSWLFAETVAAAAVNLSPWDYQARRLLATAQELNGKQAEAENSLRAAVKLAPNYVELNWEFANLLVRRGKLDESLPAFRVAARTEAGLLPLAVETVWRSSGGNLNMLKALADGDTELSVAIVKFLIEQKLTPEAVSIFNSIDREAKAQSRLSPELIAALMAAGEYSLAKTVWVDLVAASQSKDQPAAPLNWMVDGLIWNGGFEADQSPELRHFDWVIRPNKYARIEIDRSVGRSGGRSLRVAFSGLDTTTLKDQIQQAIVLKPGASYRLECYAKAKDFITPAPTSPGAPDEGLRVAIIASGSVIATSDPVTSDSSDWRRLVVDFVAPTSSPLAAVAIVRIPKFSYDDPTSGTVWFDDFTLLER